MKKRLTFVFIMTFALINIVFAIDKAKLLEIKIISEIVISLTNKQNPKVCLYKFHEYEKKEYENFSEFKITNCQLADIILVKGIEEKISFKKPAFALDYISFKNCQNCIGAFYWRKGRPQIILIKENLDLFNIKVNKELQNYVVSKRLAQK